MILSVRWIGCLSLLLGLTSALALGQPTISGNLSGTLGPGTFIVAGSCTVPAGQTLTIAPGTTLLYSGNYFFNVYGQLNANGTPNDSIKFLRQNPTETCRNRGIRFQVGSSASNSLSYCWVDFAKNQTFPIYTGGALYVKNAGLTLSHCRITNSTSNTGGGLYAENSTVIIEHCYFDEDTAEMGAGIYATGCTISIDSTEVYRSQCINAGYGGGSFSTTVHKQKSVIATSLIIPQSAREAPAEAAGSAANLRMSYSGTISFTAILPPFRAPDNGVLLYGKPDQQYHCQQLRHWTLCGGWRRLIRLSRLILYRR